MRLLRMASMPSLPVWFAFVLCCPGTAEAGRLVVLIAADVDAPKIGADMRLSARTIEDVCRSNAASSVLSIAKVPEGNFTTQSIEQSLLRLNVQADDSVLFYYLGHGAYDNRPGRGTYLLPSGDAPQTPPLFVGRVDEIIREKYRPGFSAVIVDCCNRIRAAPGPAPAPAFAPAEGLMSPLFRRLFFGSESSVVIVSSAPGEYAVIMPSASFNDETGRRVSEPQGALFTQMLALSLADRDTPQTWGQVVRAAQHQVDEMFPILCPRGVIRLGDGTAVSQRSQDITAFIDGRPISARGR